MEYGKKPEALQLLFKTHFPGEGGANDVSGEVAILKSYWDIEKRIVSEVSIKWAVEVFGPVSFQKMERMVYYFQII